MIEWVQRWKRGNPATCPQEDGQYLVYNIAGQWDCEWSDVAIFSGGKFHSFIISPTFSCDDRVYWWAKLNNPARMPEAGKTIEIDPGIGWIKVDEKYPSTKPSEAEKDMYLVYNVDGQFGADLIYNVDGRPGAERVDVASFYNGIFYGCFDRPQFSPYVGTCWCLKLSYPTDEKDDG